MTSSNQKEVIREWLKRRAKSVVKRILILRGMHKKKGRLEYRDDRPTIVVVSHEASETGAPILALNICSGLKNRANIIVILLKRGKLENKFLENCVALLQKKRGPMFDRLLIDQLNRITRNKAPKYAIINSIVSAEYIQPLRSSGIPTLTLIHEFSSYIRPLNQLGNVAIWSDKLIFSSKLTLQSVIDNFPSLLESKVQILPQGRCKTINNKMEDAVNKSRDEAKDFLDKLQDDELLILGAGQIQPRKGVDLFISVADQVRQYSTGKKYRFAWIGSGYDPINDYGVSIWLEDQINRSGLSEIVSMLENSPSYIDLIKRTDIFLVTSRLDPFPNVAIDALSAGKPVLCFEKACGVSDLLEQDEILNENLIVQYLRTDDMARKVSYLINNSNIRKTIGSICYSKAKSWFDMKDYVCKLDRLGTDISNEEKHLKKQEEYLKSYRIIDESYFCGKISNKRNKIEEQYLRSWRTGLNPRKPFPGFHPGIYKEIYMRGDEQALYDPLVHYLKSERPQGPWNNETITPIGNSSKTNEMTVGIHVHIYYPELVQQIFKAISLNSSNTELIISTHLQSIQEVVDEKAKEFDINIVETFLTPNRGRDLGPLLTDIGRLLDSNYEIHGHFHTKKSVHLANHQSNKWRDFLISNLIGNTKVPMADIIISKMKSEPDIGLVFADDPHCAGWDKNIDEGVKLLKKLNIDKVPYTFNFPIGTMFWAKRGALRPLYNLGLKWEDYPDEPIDTDGTLLHAIERLIPMVAESQGYRYCTTNIPGCNR